MNSNGKAKEKNLETKTQDKVNKLVSELRKRGKTLLDEGIESAREVYEDKKETVKRKAGELQDKSVDEIAEDLKVYVRRNPLKSLGIAAFLGLVIGAIFKSND
jgi:ElaB/YqjD/DUF883 family membrane-anchored ribosome-binding protein